MSIPETPAQTDAERILAAVEHVDQRIGALINAVNNLGENNQWLIDQAKGIFQMFSSPGFMANMGGILGGMSNGGQSGPEEFRPEAVGPAGESSDGK